MLQKQNHIMSSNGESITIHDPYEEGYDFYIKDKWNNQYQFRISTFEVPSGLLSKAIEVTDDNPEREPRMFDVLSDFEADIEEAELVLKAKIKRSINRRHLVEENGKLSIGKEETLRGRIEESDDHSDSQFARHFVIDGRRITIEQFVEMLEPYPTFGFKFQIYDPSENIE
ncbi:MAG: DUF7713 domain-containing protein [Candidatus Woesearchaeota archaeon]